MLTVFDCKNKRFGRKKQTIRYILSPEAAFPGVGTLPGGVPARQLFFEVGDRASGGFEQHEQVVDEVRSLVDHRLAVLGHGLDDGLHSLLADLLRDLVHAAVEELRGVGAFGHLGVTSPDDALQVADETFGFGHGLSEAGFRPRVAGRAVGDDADEQRVAVAVGGHRHDVEPVAAGLALGPETLARAAVKRDAAFGEAFFIGFAVHVAQHEDLEGAVVLNDGGDESAGEFCGVERRKRFSFDFHSGFII